MLAVSVPRADRNQIARAEGLGSLDRFLVRPRYTYGQQTPNLLKRAVINGVPPLVEPLGIPVSHVTRGACMPRRLRCFLFFYIYVF